jgi:hypothetical protein
LNTASVDAFLTIQEGNPATAKREPALKSASVWDVLAELGGEDR